jgi:hypothetical protein
VPDQASRSLDELSRLYLGNILYALERAAMSLDAEGKTDDAAFYRGIARVLADAYGRETPAVGN